MLNPKTIYPFFDFFSTPGTETSLVNELNTRGLTVQHQPPATGKCVVLGHGAGAYKALKWAEDNTSRVEKIILLAPELLSEHPITIADRVFKALPGIGQFWFKKNHSKFGARSAEDLKNAYPELLKQNGQKLSGSALLPFSGLCIFADRDERVHSHPQENELKRVCPAVKVEEIHGAQHDFIQTHAVKIAEMILRELKS